MHHPTRDSHHPQGYSHDHDSNHVDSHNESSPLMVPSPRTRSPSPASYQATLEGQRSCSPKKAPSHDDALEDSDSDTLDSSSGSGSSSASASGTVAATASGHHLTGEHPGAPSHSHHRHAPRHTQPSTIQMLLAVLAQVGLLVFFGGLLGALAKAPWVYPYSWHPICMGLYGFLATEAILILQPVEKGSQKKVARNIHAILHSFTLVCLVVGFVAIYVNKERLGKIHFHTNHALLGCLALFIFVLQAIFGLSVTYGPRSLYHWIGQARIVRIHRVAGYVSIALVWGTLWLAVLTNWMKKNFDHEWLFALGMAMVAVGLVGGVTPARLYRRSRTHSTHLSHP